ncbi:soluble diacylglycerol acyltransferase [Trifolium pratense]|uniref:Soluble diacylglycerol acyltransferase n=1 Tax=Trifolium pratense TaxID=57577 RepID=A0A2K3N839_TRIPR|nr:diacylglycerol O-acyltransferase 3 [Trifolium pratense]PNX78570.1 soluble diacylglycerol acyltransferase [Trifolium pratense]PNX97506.1 soluble diacylglycerol acyltransferase [Trifolium pratense]PNX99217.1 soluble diacylglycerol acyltransferase [Trifolium pratense]
MEVSGTVLRQITYISGVGTNPRSHGVVPRRDVVRVRMSSMESGFRDDGHVQYYQDTKNREPVMTTKKKLKLLKRFTKNVSSFPQLGFASDSNQPNLLEHLQNLTTGGGEELLRELEKVRAEEKELKKKMKQEKKKAKSKASKMKTCDKSSSSSSESESSDSECGEVVDMNTFRGTSVGVATKPVEELELQPPASPAALLPQQTTIGAEGSTQHHHVMDVCSTNDASVVGFKKETNVVIPAAQKRIEVCMGNKCKKSGAAALLEEFEKVVGVEGAGSVVGCKCMGKCKSAPNVRIQNSVDHSMVQGLDDSVKIPSNPLCIGVGLEDVDTIVARFLGESHEDLGIAAATS